jgi:hypothetical protein
LDKRNPFAGEQAFEKFRERAAEIQFVGGKLCRVAFDDQKVGARGPSLFCRWAAGLGPARHLR